MITLLLSDLHGWSSATEDVVATAGYDPAARKVRLALTGIGGHSAVATLDPGDATRLCNALMSSIHEHKLASRPPPPPQPRPAPPIPLRRLGRAVRR